MDNKYQFAVSVVKKAGELLLQASQKKIEVAAKNSNIQDIVTNVDIEINTFISEEINKSFPDEIIYSEEETQVDISSGSFWSIDPIDGTSSFSRNIPHFAVVLTYVQNGTPQTGAIFNPVTNELFSFEKGKGAFLNGKAVKVSGVEELKHSYAFIRIGRDQSQWDWGIKFYRFLLGNANKTYSFGSSSLDLCFVGTGRVEICVYGTLTTMDVAAALGFIKEAGGIVVDKNGYVIKTLSKEKQIVMAVNNQKILSSLKTGII